MQRDHVRRRSRWYGAESSPLSLFFGGANGAWYDPSDFSTMFQDAAGTTPVTAVGQPVGLMLDKSKGLVPSPELVTNGDFGTDTGWTKGAGWTISGGSANANIATGSNLDQSAITTSGKFYAVTFTVSNYVSGGVRIRFTGTANISGAVRSANGTYTEYLNATTTNATLRVTDGGAGFVGSVDNISVRELPGNHAYNPSGNSANFPVLSARYNLLTKTADFSDAAWGMGANVSVTQNTLEVTDPQGTYTSAKFNSAGTSGAAFVRQIFTIPLIAHTGRVWVRKGNYRYFGLRVVNNDPSTGDYVVLDFDANGGNGGIAYVPASENVSYSFTKLGEWFEFTVTNLPNASPRYFQIGISDAAGSEAPTVPTNSFVYVWHPDLRVSNDALNQPAYQRVNTASDYDTAGFKPYLSFNGVNQWLQTNSIDFTYGDKVFVSAGVRRLSDAAVGMLVELSVNRNDNTGAFSVSAPHLTGIGGYGFGNKGTVDSFISVSGYTAPITSVLSGLGDISGDQATLRVNGTQAAISTADQGTGNYGNYPLYIGARGGSSLYFNGRLYGLVVVGKQASASEIASTEAWLNQKTGAY